MDGVFFHLQKRIEHPNGDIFHGLKCSETSFKGFGEVYFSQVHQNRIKAWKKHKRMTLNLIVPIGQVLFVFYDDRVGSKNRKSSFSYVIGEENYGRLTVAPGIWFGFMGLGEGINLILNLADLEHDPLEVERKAIEEISFEWPAH